MGFTDAQGKALLGVIRECLEKATRIKIAELEITLSGQRDYPALFSLNDVR